MSPIVSASRRTDIPAFYTEWLLGRLEAGFAEVPNPYNPAQVSTVSLLPTDIDALVFWTKNPAPMLDHLEEIQHACDRFLFQFTLNHYPKELEPGLPALEDRIGTFEKLAGIIGPERVIWRYDPIIFSNQTDAEFHRKNFSDLCARLAGSTRRVMVSLVDYYKKTLRNLAPLEAEGYEFGEEASGKPGTRELLSELASIASRYSLSIFTCAEETDYTGIGLPPGACIDGELLSNLFGIDKVWKKDQGQRKHCKCVASRDIGAFDTCLHGCPYCYATRNTEIARERHRLHDPGAAVLSRYGDPART
jgi:hypothetical protein